MPDLPALRPVEVVSALERAGFDRRRQRGSHAFLVNASAGRQTTVAMHSRDMSKRMLREVLKQAGLSVEEFLKLV